MTAVDALVEFLLTRIAEDEEQRVTRFRGGPSPTPRELREAARWEAECKSKRRIVEAYRDARARRDIYESDDARAVEDDEQATRRRSAAARTRGLEIALEALALPYADHPDFRDEWRT